MLVAAAWAAVAFAVTTYIVGWRGWFVVGPLIILLWINPAWAALFFLIAVGIVAGGVLLWAIWKILPWAIFFGIGIWLAYGLVIGLGMLFGLDR